MILMRFYDEMLAQASYLVACDVTGEAMVVDPTRDVEQYLRAAEAEGVRVTNVTETHIHADFVSGARELAQRAGARLLLSEEGGADGQYAYAAETAASLLRDGDGFRVGNLRIDVLHTPGHTPEHLTFLVTDGAAADRPMGAFTGDFLFAGDVGRPDLLERASDAGEGVEEGARTLFRSLRRFRAQPDYLQIWPGHCAKSDCEKGPNAVRHSTIGYERLFNWAFSIEDEEEFVRALVASQPETPAGFARMKRINREGPRILGGLPRPERLPPERLASVLESGALVIGTRDASDFAVGHVPGTLNIPLDRSFTTWAGALVPDDRDLYLMTDVACAHCADEAARALVMVGLDRVVGSFDSRAVWAWGAEHGTLQTVPRTQLEELAAHAHRGWAVLDVRSRAEWEAGHIPGVSNVPLGDLPGRLDELPRDRPLVVHCQTGARSAVAASFLQGHGFTNVLVFAGGFRAWKEAGEPVEIGGAPGPVS